MDFSTIQAQLANLTSQLSQIAERTTMHTAPTLGVPYGQGYQTDQRPQFTANGGAWGYQGYDQPSNNMFSHTYNSDWRDYTDSMWWEAQQVQHEGYWQPYEEIYSRPAQPPQPHIQYAQSNSGSSIDYDQILNELNSLVQGSQNQAQEAQQGEYWQQAEEFYQWPYAPSQPLPQSSQTNLGTSMDNDQIVQLLTSLTQETENQTKRMKNQAKKMDELEKQVGQIVEFMAQIQEQSELSNSTNVNSMGDFEITAAITLGSDMEVGISPKASKQRQKEDEKLLPKEDEEEEEQPLPQLSKAPMPPNSSKVVSNSIISNPIPPNVPFPRRFMQSTKDEGKKDILETFPKIKEEEVARDYIEFIKEAIPETTKPKEVEFYDTGQVTTITLNLAKSNIPETFKDVVFVLEFLSEQTGKPSFLISISLFTNMLILMIQAPTLEFKPLPDHFKYHRPFKDQFHAMGPRGV